MSLGRNRRQPSNYESVAILLTVETTRARAFLNIILQVEAAPKEEWRS